MSRSWIAAVIVALSAVAQGCCMCNAPYDYCGPTYTGGNDVPCLIDERVGSAFNGWQEAQQAGYEEGVEQSAAEQIGPPNAQPPAAQPQEHYQPQEYYQQDVLPAPPQRTTQRSYQNSAAMRRGSSYRNRPSNGQNFRLLDYF